MDQIKIENLEIFCNHGVLEEENRLGQKFLVSLVMYLDTKKAGMNDDFNCTVDYSEICHFIYAFMQEKTFSILEAVAENLCTAILRHYGLVQAVELEVKKPWAPIGLHLDAASVKIKRGWHTAYIALGSNIGDREEQLMSALEDMDADVDVVVEDASSFIETEPYGPVEQDMFLNSVAKIRTLLDPFELLAFLHEIEEEHGRERVIKWGPRTLDLDILFYDDLVMGNEELVIPHIDIANRDFVLMPMNEIAPGFVHPVYRKTMRQMTEELRDRM